MGFVLSFDIGFPFWEEEGDSGGSENGIDFKAGIL